MANDISMVRGDSKIIAVDVYDTNGAAYNPAVNDVVTLTIRALSDFDTIVLDKTSGDLDVSIVAGGWEITLQPVDTEDFDYDESYVYDIEVVLADGYKQTIIPYSALTLVREVTI